MSRMKPPLTRNATEPSAFGAQTRSRSTSNEFACSAAPVLTLNSSVPRAWLAAASQAARRAS